MSRLNVLALHRMGPEGQRREAVERLEFMIAEERPDLNIITHDASLPFPEFVAEFPFDLVVLHATFLGSRTSHRKLELFRSTYGETIRQAGCRVALPQDDYDSSALLDDLMVEWAVDRVYCVIPDRWDKIYPRFVHVGEIRAGYTGYISARWINQWHSPKPRSERLWDVTYRTHDRGAIRCDLRHLKFAIAERFLAAVGSDSTLSLNISSRAADTIPGPQWHDFLEDSRFCLATPSGSSFLDPQGTVRQCVKRLRSRESAPTIEDARSECFPAPQDGRPFSAISPRHIEAGLALTVQIATPGDYSGLMQPDENYIRLEEDCRNISEVLATIAHDARCMEIAAGFKERLLSEPRLRRRRIVEEIIELGEERASMLSSRRPTQDEFDRLRSRYLAHLQGPGRVAAVASSARAQLIRLADASAPRLTAYLRRGR